MRGDKTLDLLRWTLGATAFAAGADKFTNLLADWEKYLAPVAERNLPIRADRFMQLVGVIEMLVGALILSGHRKLGGYIAGGWLLAVSANLIAGGEYLDIAARDINMAMAALVLAATAGAKSHEHTDFQPLEKAA